MNTGPALMLRASYEQLPRVELAFEGLAGLLETIELVRDLIRIESVNTGDPATAVVGSGTR